ncbi:DUF6932 family protein [Desulfomicrobium salsuginis]
MIPELVDVNGIWDVLPPGIHDATLDEIENRFATTAVRRKLFEGFKLAAQSLYNAGCRAIYLDGSFVTEKVVPGDFDVCWDLSGVDTKKLDPVFFDFDNKRKNQKQKFGGEFFPSNVSADGRRIFLDFFQSDRHSGKPKGIIRVVLA